MMDLTLKLREARMSAGLTQSELAQRSGVGVKSISSFETGARAETIKYAQLRAIVAACGMTMQHFFSPAFEAEALEGAYCDQREIHELVTELLGVDTVTQKRIVRAVFTELALAKQRRAS